MAHDVTALVLCGGRGTRAYPHTVEVPKPLLDVGGTPILRHVLDIYARQGFTRFVLAAGYLADRICDFAEQLPADWQVVVRDTGVDTDTAERVIQCADEVGEEFFVTYGDGVANIDLRALLAFHHSHGRPATLTTVPLRSQYGTIEATGDGRVTSFLEKPLLQDHSINGGFFVFRSDAFDFWSGTNLETSVLPHLASSGNLFAYRHEGFWKSMDTYKDSLDLAGLIKEGHPPWHDRVTMA